MSSKFLCHSQNFTTKTNPVLSCLVTRLDLRFDPAVSPVTRLEPYDPPRSVGPLNINNNATHGCAVEVVIECHTLLSFHWRAPKSRLVSWQARMRLYIDIIAVACNEKQTFEGVVFKYILFILELLGLLWHLNSPQLKAPSGDLKQRKQNRSKKHCDLRRFQMT